MADSNLEREFLDAHNKYRRTHGAPPLTLSRDLCSSAQKWADHLLSIKTLQHSSTNHGENLYYSCSSAPKKLNGNDAVDSWYSEIKDYRFDKPGFTSGTGHFTQVVWKDSQQLGLGVATDGQTVFVVGQYHPAGNISNPGYFQRNVFSPGSSATGSGSGSPKVACDSYPGKGGERGGASSNSTVYKQQSGPNKDTDGGRFKGQAKDRELDQDTAAFQREFLRECNARRQPHGAPALSLSSSLCQEAEAWAHTLLRQRTLKNSSSGHGENIWAKTGPVGTTATAEEVVGAWYKQKQNYNFSRPGNQAQTGQFTQLVWRGSEEVGVGRASGSGMVVVVAFFNPAGNITNPGYHQENVLPEGSKVNSRPLEDVSAKFKGLAVGVGTSTTAIGSNQFSHALLKSVNQYRSQHGAEPLSLSPALGKEAQDWSTHLVSINTLKNSNKGHGESIFYRSGSSRAPPSGTEVAESWYKEIEKYKFSSPGFQKGAGNFTQMVWKSSKEVGFGLATNGGGMFIAVAFYDPAGNVTNPGYFHDNVKAKGSRH